MINLIKKINMERVFYNLSDDYSNVDESIIEKLCIKVENNLEFKKLFFFIDESCHDYFYESKNEEKIKNFLSVEFKDYIIPKHLFQDFRQSLIDDCSCDYIELHSRLGKINISEEVLYTSLYDEFLNEDEYIRRLVGAEDFYAELAKIKKECLKYLFNLAIVEANMEIENIEL